MEEVEKRCKRPGCAKKYQESQNSSVACKFHNGKPIFHDLKKGWTCCNIIVYEWEEFQKIQGCCTGAHSDEKLEGDLFYQSSTVAHATNGKGAVIIQNSCQERGNCLDENSRRF
jgi:disease resistance protein